MPQEKFSVLFFLFLIILGLMNLFFITVFFKGLKNSKIKSAPLNQTLRISILVPARNEETFLEKCILSLLAQDYPQHLTQLIFIDDDSTDGTWRIMSRYSDNCSNLLALRSPEWREGLPRSPKKKALFHGIENATGDLILACDADCTAPETWATSMVSCFTQDIVMVAGYAGIDKPGDKQNFFIKFQALELLSMFTCAAGSINSGWPLASSGSNQAFWKQEFLSTGGYGSSGHLVSGDDDLLLQRLTRLTGKKAIFNNDPKSYMHTAPMPDVKSFYSQRKRWGAKYTHYKTSYKIFLAQYYLLTTTVLALLLMTLFERSFIFLAFSGLLIKLLPEYTLLLRGTSYFQRKDLRKYLPLWSCVQMPYITIMGALSLVTKTSWKGRQFSTRSRIDVDSGGEP